MISDVLVGLKLAKYIVLRLVNNNESIEKESEDFDNDIHFINRVVKFLEDVEWIKQNDSRDYRMTNAISLKVSSSRIIV